jgi:hypothetical protein
VHGWNNECHVFARFVATDRARHRVVNLRRRTAALARPTCAASGQPAKAPLRFWNCARTLHRTNLNLTGNRLYVSQSRVCAASRKRAGGAARPSDERGLSYRRTDCAVRPERRDQNSERLLLRMEVRRPGDRLQTKPRRVSDASRRPGCAPALPRGRPERAVRPDVWRTPCVPTITAVREAVAPPPRLLLPATRRSPRIPQPPQG